MKVPTPRKLSSGSWNIQIRLGGRNISITAPTKEKCVEQAKKAKKDHQNGRVFCPENETLKKLADRYLEDRSGVLSPSTIRGYKIIVDRYKHLHDRLPDRIRWQAEVSAAARKYSAKTVKNDFGFWGSVLRYAGITMPQLKLPQIVHDEHPWLTPEQIPIFLDAIRGGTMEIGCLLALHGLRLSELLALEKGSVWNNTIFIRGAVVRTENGPVSKETNKNTSSRREVPVLIERLNELVAAIPDGPLHPYNGNSLYLYVNRVCERAGLPKVGVHGLRHSFASLCYHAGLSERQTMALGGWSDPATMRKIYTHLSAADRDAGAEQLRDFFRNKPKNSEKILNGKNKV